MYKNEKGITLVELLAVLAIMSVVIALISSVHLFGQRQYIDQSETIEHQSEVRVAVSQITKDIRKVNSDAVNIGTNQFVIGDNAYTLEATKIKRNDTIISEEISDFSMSFDEDKGRIDLTITSLADNKGNQHSISTSIYLRE
ncbi:PilW family protein [Gracilibacillus marinus]|uniref:PilW family protein n=1 Tax=Gracilibacillus marinus TaxID=630535 RepID=A0ABV8VRA1_9BACI